ncbi:bifunctional 5,10-methylenetetrahydrofolate dehydrogenase/5,10-methenyltetrahydrofolate cyclohydrolase [Peloplasma aerotolerans]|uniref:Bifunctional protein FolD n=1 Tax=Peloplasma aerotolerans TaxID=3044389 RepID=A0AAW6U6T2_9MOLU|nr:bifunctional 5,10-methylenetetrahydrofolate dehydrogenase/5,10-methenyltetrahydrofolate cyclohydrolase [Mariniplasma sp. M4Ah]MDI6452232.1 bifunctional 5,10-methylenetetrahydrofolate dehydrogenase/5,10-methenyltetrahydrofolate cyclohydrolase [Mariniplasma sp. M4Ah]
MILLDGAEVANRRNLELNKKILKSVEKYKRAPSLSIILVGQNPASLSYVKGKGKACKLVGIKHKLYHLDENIKETELAELITTLNNDDQVDGILLQLPLPHHLDDDKLINLISKDKDADGFHVINQGNLYQKRETVYPATPKGIMSLLSAYDIDVKGMNAVIIGRSNIVGFPVARLLMDQGATITVCHRQTKDLSLHTKQADLIIASAGRAELVTKDMVKNGAIVVDVGVNRVDGKLVGDVHFDGVKEVAGYLSPVPRGVGPMTINALLENTYDLYLKHIK